MMYTKEEAKKSLDKAIESLKSNPQCGMSEEQLEKQRAMLSTEESLNTIAQILTALDAEFENFMQHNTLS